VRLIFVDDEPLLLQGLQRSLRSMAGEWTMDFVSSGAEALAKMESVPVDVVVTDMRMPGMDGAQLLHEVQKRYPETVRFVLSGQSSREAVLRFIGRSHQFLSKPCDIKELKGRIEAAFLLRSLLGSARVKEVISRLTSVPSLPALYDEIMGELESKDPSAARVGDIVARDVAMAAKVLQLANSALLGLRCQISNVHQAVLLIGMEMMRALGVSVHIFSHFDADRLGDLDLARLWKHSVCTAKVALAIARAEHVPKQVQEDSFSAGLLHDIGKLILAATMADRYKEVVKRVRTEEVTLVEAERQSFECTHAEVGAYLVGIWGLPPSIVETAAWHHLPSTSGARTFAPLTAVHVANVLIGTGEFSHLGDHQALDEQHLADVGMADRKENWKRLCDSVIWGAQAHTEVKHG
jgi:putative nucleotidyltransferase with HDIG domain